MNNRIPPIPMMLHIIGNIPTSYAMAMSYEEQLLCLKNYLCKEVVPTMNKNIEEIQELITYINNYFDNLDVQDEINNKIDEMIESGELQEIITSYLQVNGVLAFNTLNDMLNSTNIIDGSTCRTLGLNSFNDGKGELYKIREITNEDVVDGVNIITIPSSETLIAELITKYDIENLQSQIYEINEEIDEINEEIENVKDEHYLFLGDSYGMPTATYNWVNVFNNIVGLTNNVNSFNLCRGASGFISDGTNTYYNNLVNNISSIPNKDKIKHVVICGGWNDRGSVYEYSDTSSISTLISYIKTQFKNAKIYCGMISNYSQIDDQAASIYWRDIVTNYMLNFYKECEKYGATYLNGVENVMHNYSYFDSDYIHPNEAGTNALGRAIFEAVSGGYYADNRKLNYMSINSSSTYFTLSSFMNSNSNLAITNKCVNNTNIYKLIGTLNFANPIALTSTSKMVGIATYNSTLPYIRYVGDETDFRGMCIITDTDSISYRVPYKLHFDRTGYVYLTMQYDTSINTKSINSVSFDDIHYKYSMFI